MSVFKVGRPPPLSKRGGTPKRKHKRKRRSPVAAKMRVRIWDMHMGSSTKHPCILCGVRQLSRSNKYGFEAAHIVAWKYCGVNNDAYLLIPSCSTCNSEMGDENMFDWLISRSRYEALRQVAWTIWRHYTSEFEKERNRSIVSVFRRLYGRRRFARGGYIEDRNVYHCIQQLQLLKIHQRQKALSTELERLSLQAQHIMEEPIEV